MRQAGRQLLGERAARSETDIVSAKPTTLERAAAVPAVVTAQLCTALRNWQCEAADGEAPAGPMFFFTQLKSETATTIEHRWYRDDRLYQRVPLRIRANPSGFRTYSQTRIGADRAGKWKVELRSQDGELLDEKTFAVQ